MSVKQMSRVWDLDLDHAQRLVLLALADHAHDDGGGVRPAVALVAWKTGYSLRSVKRLMASLRKANLITIERQGGGDYPNVYRLCLERGKSKPPYKGQGVSAGTSAILAPVPKAVNGMHENGHVHTRPDTLTISRTINEPSKERTSSSLPAVAGLWNTIVKRPLVLRVSGQREVHLRARMETYADLDWWRQVLERLMATPFLRGGGPRGWMADFDWLTRNDENPIRVLEGKYDELTVRDALAGLPEGRA